MTAVMRQQARGLELAGCTLASACAAPAAALPAAALPAACSAAPGWGAMQRCHLALRLAAGALLPPLARRSRCWGWLVAHPKQQWGAGGKRLLPLLVPPPIALCVPGSQGAGWLCAGERPRRLRRGAARLAPLTAGGSSTSPLLHGAVPGQCGASVTR